MSSNLGSLFGVNSTSTSQGFGGGYFSEEGENPRFGGGSDHEGSDSDGGDFRFIKKGGNTQTHVPQPAPRRSLPHNPGDSLKYVPPKEPNRRESKSSKKKAGVMPPAANGSQQNGEATQPSKTNSATAPASIPVQSAQPAIIFSSTIYLFKEESGTFQPHPTSTKLGMVILASPNGNSLLVYDASKTTIVQAALPVFEILSPGYFTFTALGVKFSLTFEQAAPLSPQSADEIIANYVQSPPYKLGMISAWAQHGTFNIASGSCEPLVEGDTAGLIYALYHAPVKSNMKSPLFMYDKSQKAVKVVVGSDDGCVGGVGKAISGMAVGAVRVIALDESARSEGTGTRVNIDERVTGNGVIILVCSVVKVRRSRVTGSQKATYEAVSLRRSIIFPQNGDHKEGGIGARLAFVALLLVTLLVIGQKEEGEASRRPSYGENCRGTEEVVDI